MKMDIKCSLEFFHKQHGTVADDGRHLLVMFNTVFKYDLIHNQF